MRVPLFCCRRTRLSQVVFQTTVGGCRKGRRGRCKIGMSKRARRVAFFGGALAGQRAQSRPVLPGSLTLHIYSFESRRKGARRSFTRKSQIFTGLAPLPSTFPLESASTHGHRSPRTVAWQTTARPSHTPPAPALSLPRPPSSPPPPALAPPPIPPSLLPTLPSAPSPRPKRTEDRGGRGTSGGTRFSLGSFLGRRWECKEVSEGGRMGLRQLF